MRPLGNVAQDKVLRACKCDSRKGRAAEKQKERQEIVGAIPDEEIEHVDSYDESAKQEWLMWCLWGDITEDEPC